MTPSTQSLAQRVLDFHLIEIDSVTSAADGEASDVLSDDLFSTKSMVDVAASRCSYGIKNGLDHVLDGSLTTTLADVLNSSTAAPLQNGVLHSNTDDFITRNHGHPRTVSINRSACENEADDWNADDVLVDVVSGTSGELSSLHHSLCQNAQGNLDLDDATPVEPFVQELVQWKKARIRPKKSEQGGSLQFTPSNNKRKRSPSVSHSKRQKTSIVEKLRADTEGSAVFSGVSRCVVAPSIVEKCFVYLAPEVPHKNTLSSIAKEPSEQKPNLVESLRTNTESSAFFSGLSRCVMAPSIVEKRFVYMAPEVPHKNTLSSIANKPSELRQFRNRLPVELGSNSLTALYKDVKNVAISRPKVGAESLLMTNYGANTPVRLTDTSSNNPSAFALTPNPVTPSQLTTSQPPRPSLASADGSLKVDANGIIDISKAIEPSMISAEAKKETSRGNKAPCPNVVSFEEAVEVVDLELEESDVDEGEELLLADTDADLASAVQFVELRPDDVICDSKTSVAVEESPDEQTIAGGTAGTRVSDGVFGSDEGQLTAIRRPEGDGEVGDGESKREGCELRGLARGRKAAKGLTPSKDGREVTLLCQYSAVSKTRVRRKTVIKYHATALALEMFTRGKVDDRLKENYLLANRVEESRLKWHKLLHGNKFNERETGAVSRVKQFQDDRLSPSRDALLMEGLQDGNSPVVQCQIRPLEYCKKLSSDSVSHTHLVKRGKHWFKKILPPPLKTLNEVACVRQEGPANCRSDSLPPSRSVFQSAKPGPEISFQPPLSSGFIRYVTDPIMPSTEDSPTCAADGLAPREVQVPSRTSHSEAADGSLPQSPSFRVPQDHPEVQFVAVEDVTEVDDDHDAVSFADDCDPLGGDAEDPFSGIRTVDAGRDPGDAVGSDGHLQEQTLLKFDPQEDFSDSGLGNSVDSNSFSPGVIHIKSEYNEERSIYVHTSASLDENSNSSVRASFSYETNVPFGGAKTLCLLPPSEEMELQPPPGMSVRQYNLTSDAIHFHQSKQMIMDPMMVHQIQQGGDSRLPGVCDAEDFILRNFSSTNYVFCEVDPNTSHLPPGLHRFSLQVKGNRVYRSSKPRLTFRIHDASCDDTASGTSAEVAVAGNSGSSNTDTTLLKCSGGLTDDESTSSCPRLSSSGSLIMRDPHADLKRYLLASDRLQKLFAGLQQIQQTEKAARLTASDSSNSPLSSAHAEALQELYSKRVHMQVHFHRVLHYLKVTWFREKIREAKCRTAVNDSFTGQHAS